MKFSYKWLCELIPGLEKYSVNEIADKLTFSGMEIEGIEDQTKMYQGIVVGEVILKEKHPDADKLSLCRVRTAKEEFQVVCGAPNVAAGKKYPFATLGTVMPDGLIIKPIKLRGVESSGMLCSAKELGMSDENSGLMELDVQFKTGESISKALNLDDVILEANVTPNRGDALSHWGMACDVSAITGLAVHYEIVVPHGIKYLSANKSHAKENLKIKIRDTKACGRFTGSQIFNVQITSSPLWLKRRLESLGIRSINNIVDATNYVIMLTGHPVHAYDQRDISDQTIFVDTLSSKQEFKTLDGETRKLESSDLIISDAKKAVGLAGIMGGENSEIKDDTKDVILEVAHFNPDIIRKTAHRLGLQTDSSYRFERFVNPETVFKAHEILQNLILNLAGGTVTKIIDVYPQKHSPVKITLTSNEIHRILGIDVPKKDVLRILKGLNCKVTESKDSYKVIAPIGRSDLVRPIDLIEEIARLYGLDKIPAVMPEQAVRYSRESRYSEIEFKIKDFFVNQGFYEVIHYSFGDQNNFQKILRTHKTDSWIHLKNPISEELSVMRPSILPQLISCYQKNRLNSEKGFRIFELRTIYHVSAEGTIKESLKLVGLYVGNPMGRNRFGYERNSDLFDGKGILKSLFKNAHISVDERVYELWPYHPGQTLGLYHNNHQLAIIGALHPELLQEQKIKETLYSFEIDFEYFVQIYQQEPLKFHAVSSLPSVYRDLALLVPQEVTYQNILEAIDKEKPEFLKDVDLFDLYEGENLPKNKKSIAISMIYEPKQQSLTDDEVNKMHFKLVETLKTKLGVELR